MISSAVYQNLADINLWFKIHDEDPYTMMDIPTLITNRWDQFKTKWGFLIDQALILAADAPNSDFIREQIHDFTDFIETQRSARIAINPFSDNRTIHRYYEVFNILPIDIIPVNNDEQRIIDQAINRVRAFTKTDFFRIKNEIRGARDEIADISNAFDINYNDTFHRSPLSAQKEITINDIKLMQQLQNAIIACDFILSNITSLDSVSIDPFALLRSNANNPDIPLESYSSGKLVKMNFGEDLRMLADRYLGNPDKWIEIAVANGLHPPYIDENGIKIKLLSNASSNQINIADVDEKGEPNINKFYIGQLVILQSNVEVRPEQRKIIAIREIPVSNDIVIELDGETNLERYRIIDDAHIRVYKKNTAHSGLYILIPSNDPINPEVFKETPWFLQTSSSDERQAKIDLALSPDFDLMFTANSDLQLSYGLDNAIQAVKLKLITEQGELMRHKEYGLVNIQGLKNTDIDSLKETLVQSINDQIENDSRYERVVRLDVNYSSEQDPKMMGVGFFITLVVQLAGSDTAVPISFSINVM